MKDILFALGYFLIGAFVAGLFPQKVLDEIATEERQYEVKLLIHGAWPFVVFVVCPWYGLCMLSRLAYCIGRIIQGLVTDIFEKKR